MNLSPSWNAKLLFEGCRLIDLSCPLHKKNCKIVRLYAQFCVLSCIWHELVRRFCAYSDISALWRPRSQDWHKIVHLTPQENCVRVCVCFKKPQQNNTVLWAQTLVTTQRHLVNLTKHWPRFWKRSHCFLLSTSGFKLPPSCCVCP